MRNPSKQPATLAAEPLLTHQSVAVADGDASDDARGAVAIREHPRINPTREYHSMTRFGTTLPPPPSLAGSH